MLTSLAAAYGAIDEQVRQQQGAQQHSQAPRLLQLLELRALSPLKSPGMSWQRRSLGQKDRGGAQVLVALSNADAHALVHDTDASTHNLAHSSE